MYCVIKSRTSHAEVSIFHEGTEFIHNELDLSTSKSGILVCE